MRDVLQFGGVTARLYALRLLKVIDVPVKSILLMIANTLLI